jgi:predicted nucleic acid-binding protein
MQTIYLDSCIVIYLVEKHPQYFAELVNKIKLNAQARFVVSSLTALEVLAKPRKEQNVDLLSRYQVFLEQFQINGIDDQVLLKAIDFRVQGLKTPDAIHVACAQHIKCDQFWTNDNRLVNLIPGWTVNVC